ncbi:hypothetical protein POJ06DRAFT_252342 [Lipomyces tetrasporus]|uniref:Dienelactone hydrolase domain-containing protein n=1 Tax=Lipomyces tetrasporus TaxID=54092 RepID=A0AAD7QS58_9ASCO|nr:uncharacterized protein POJ06DRAFT_252342 [Lipomyces tetrasporus]KAJ8100323.1 hypothetical protein POJ06DRAFT_252342 [Lipomyces tetrasporus]
MSTSTRHPYMDSVPLDDTNDTIFLGESEDEDDEFFFSPGRSTGSQKRRPLSVTTPAGEYKTLPDTQERIYVSKPPWDDKLPKDSEDQSRLAEDAQGFSILLLLTNGLGIESVNNQLLADEFAREGYFVVMPDLFWSDPNTPVPRIQQQAGSLLARVKSLAISSAAGFMTDMWVARHTEERTWPMLVNMVEEIVDIYRPRDMCVVGYSFGGKYALKLLQLPTSTSTTNGQTSAQTSPSLTLNNDDPEDQLAKSPQSPLAQTTFLAANLSNPSWARLILTGIICHPSLVEPKDFVGIKKPALVIAVQDDPLFPNELIQAGTKELTKNTVFHDVKFYDRKLPHGFAVKGDYPADNRMVAENQAHAHKEVVSWIKSFVA